MKRIIALIVLRLMMVPLITLSLVFSSQNNNILTIRGGNALSDATKISSASASAATSTFLSEIGVHVKEYPDDDFSHILGISDPNHKPSKLQDICRLRLIDVIRNKLPIDTQGCGIDRTMYISADELQEEIREFDDRYGKPLNISERIAQSYPQMAIAAEFKKASPSKGDINPDLDPVVQCLEYARVGAAVISVLTEFQHFKGTLNDMRRVRLATQEWSVNEKVPRPAILRKDFILDRYQILEARANGADTVLLIVAVLGVRQLRDLIGYARNYGIEPLVEVHTEREMEIALDCGAKVIGVNNRNLHNFQLDLQTTARVVSIAKGRNIDYRAPVASSSPSSSSSSSSRISSQESHGPPQVTIAALSGITSPDDVEMFRDLGVGCCLIGETLMKSSDPKQKVQELLGNSPPIPTAAGLSWSTATSPSSPSVLLVKTCGITSAEDATAAVQAGADLVGIIFVPGSPRFLSDAEAREVVRAVRRYGERPITGSGGGVDAVPMSEVSRILSQSLREERSGRRRNEWSGSPAAWFGGMARMVRRVTAREPLVVGVFQNQPVDEINRIVSATGIDLVQLHGSESAESIDAISVPCIKVLHVQAGADTQNVEESVERLKKQVEEYSNRALAILLDTKVGSSSPSGGTGVSFDWSIVEKLGIPVLLAGGLDEDNVRMAASLPGVAGVDVSSGIEPKKAGVGPPFNPEAGRKDLARMRSYVRRARGIDPEVAARH